MNIKYFRTQVIHKLASWVEGSKFVETLCGHILPTGEVGQTTKNITCKACLRIGKEGRK